MERQRERETESDRERERENEEDLWCVCIWDFFSKVRFMFIKTYSVLFL